MENNSLKPSKNLPDKKKVEKVITGKAEIAKKNEVQKLADVFIAEDINNVKNYIVWDVLIPTIKKAVVDIVKNGIEMIVWGDTHSDRGRSSSSSKVSYRSYYDRDKDDRRSDNRPRSRFDFDDIKFESRGDAEAVLDQMADMIDRYGVVSVSDMYDMADMSAPPYTSNRYGWTNIRNADVVRVRDGYIIKLPKAQPID